MNKRASVFSYLWAFILLLLMGSLEDAKALELDWSGQFWSEFNFISNYTMGGAAAFNQALSSAGGYYTPGAGSTSANFQSLFLRLKPKLVVNDNIYIKSEWWLGNPVFGIFGNSLPYTQDMSWYNSYGSRGSVITAQRFWAEFVTDIGTIQVGRVPLHWGLGVVWNAGDNLYDRYQSTGDAVRWIAKFGSFTFIPSVIVTSIGTTIGGSGTVSSGTVNGGNVTGVGVFTPGNGGAGVQDFSLLVKYENTEDELEGGINILKRLGGSNQDPTYNISLPNPANNSGFINTTVFDIFARKKFSRLTLGAEAPIATGSLGSATYSSFAFAGEVDWKTSDALNLTLKGGYASGQASSTTSTLSNYNAFYFNPNYHIGMVMFNYQLSNFAQPQTLNNPNVAQRAVSSPYDNPINNAIYLAFAPQIKPWEKWTIRPSIIYAYAPQAASSSGYFFNSNNRALAQNTSGTVQGNDLGYEFDLGLTFQWDEYFQFSWDNGLYQPGSYYAFSNLAGTPNPTSLVYATSFRVGVNF